MVAGEPTRRLERRQLGNLSSIDRDQLPPQLRRDATEVGRNQ
jgi:hypothetical protein